MSSYAKTVNFAVKDGLASGDPNKVVKGTEIDTEFNNIATMSGTKQDSLPVSDGTAIVFNASDATKTLKFLLSGITTGTARTLTVQDADGTIAILVGGALTAPTSVTTPLVSSGNSGAIQIGNTNGTWVITAGGGGSILSPNDNVETLGNATHRLASVFTPIIDSGTTGSLSLKTNNGTTGLQIVDAVGGRNVTITPSATNPTISTTAGSLAITPAIASLGGTTASGALGVSVIVATGRATAQTAANASISTFTVGAADASFEISANVRVTTATSHNFQAVVNFTDEGSAVNALTLNFITNNGAVVTNVVNATGTVQYSGIPAQIRAKAGTAITVTTSGTFTTVTYNVEGMIKRIA